MHPKEFKKVKNNTGFFTHLSLCNSELFIGVDFSKHKRIGEILATHESYILFPSPNAVNLSEQNPKLPAKSSKEMAIFILDSTWACTNKMLQESANLRELPHLSFTTQKTSQYQIKEQPQSNYLSTIESTLVVLEELHKHKIETLKTEEFGNFLNPFFEMIAYQQKLIKTTHKSAVRYKKIKKLSHFSK
jgi:DTW domain-containing protein YfiP